MGQFYSWWMSADPPDAKHWQSWPRGAMPINGELYESLVLGVYKCKYCGYPNEMNGNTCPPAKHVGKASDEKTNWGV